MEIIRAEMEDAEALLALQKLAYRSEAALYNDDSIPPLRQTLDELRGELKSQIFLKAVEGGRIVGSVRASMKDETCHIGRLMVHPEFQGRGIGAALMHTIESLSATKRFELFTGAKSEGNIRLYQKLGYEIFQRKTINAQITLVYLEKWRVVPYVTAAPE